MSLDILDSSLTERLMRMLRDYEGGVKPTYQSAPNLPPIEFYVGIAQETIAASDGDPVTGEVAIYHYDNDTEDMSGFSTHYVTAINLHGESIAECQWLFLGRCAASGKYFIINMTLTNACNPPSGSGDGQWYCLLDPPE